MNGTELQVPWRELNPDPSPLRAVCSLLSVAETASPPVHFKRFQWLKENGNICGVTALKARLPSVHMARWLPHVIWFLLGFLGDSRSHGLYGTKLCFLHRNSEQRTHTKTSHAHIGRLKKCVHASYKSPQILHKITWVFPVKYMSSEVWDQCIIGEETLCWGVGLMNEERTDASFRTDLSAPQWGIHSPLLIFNFILIKTPSVESRVFAFGRWDFLRECMRSPF